MPTPSDQVRVAVIGAGIGQAHLKGYLQVPQAEVVAICDLNTDRATQVAIDTGFEKAQIFADYRKMLDEIEVDAVSVCLPNLLHAPVAVDCLDAGKHVISEKPLAINAAEAQKIADAAERNDKKCMVGQVNRFRSDSKYLKQLVDDGEFGNIYYSHTGWLRKRGIPGFGGWFTTKGMSGGGPLIDIGVHLLDIAWWLCGCPKPIAASGATYAEFGPHGRGQGGWGLTGQAGGTFDVEDLAVGLIRFETGLTINLEVSWAINSRKDNEMWVQLYGSEGGAEWGEPAGIFTDVAGYPVVSEAHLPKTDPWRGEMQHFIDCILNDETPDPDARQGVQMMKMLDAIYASAASGSEVKID
jgi:predicted dehydrogenase